MGVYIKGMEIPKNCGGCFLRFGQCSRRIYMENRPSDCPLIEVPKPHGDLIDASEKIRVQMYDDEHEDFHTVEMTIDDLLSQSWVKAYAFPVIPASEEG